MLLRLIYGPLIILITMASYASAEPDPSTEDWSYWTEQDGVQVWRREYKDSEVIAVRGIATLPYKIEDVFSVMSDNSRSPEWVPMVEEKTTVRQLDRDSRIEYARIKMPWPLQDRYTVAMGSLKIRAKNTYWISYQSVDGEFIDPDRIRARLELSTFYLRPEDNASTYMDITLLSDPKGSVPKFLVNTFQKNWPVQFLAGLRRQIEKVKQEKVPKQDPGIAKSLAH